jgi:hypothetical protein
VAPKADHLALAVAGDASAATEPVEPSTRILIHTAAHQARGMGHGYVGTEHVLLGPARLEDRLGPLALSCHTACAG